MKNIANDLDSFIEVVSDAERKALNTPIGQELTKRLLALKLAENPNMTVEEWQRTKSEFMTFIFAALMQNDPALMKELGGHVWNELQKA